MINYLILVAAFLAMVLTSFLPGFIELIRPKDAGPIYIDLDRDIDERYFSRAFREYVNKALPESIKKSAEGKQQKLLPKASEVVLFLNRGPEKFIVVEKGLDVQNGRSYKKSIYVKGDLTTEANCRFIGEVLVDKNCHTGTNNRFKAISGHNVRLGRNNFVSGWVDAGNYLEIGTGTKITNRATAGHSLFVEGDSVLKSLAAPTIEFAGKRAGTTARAQESLFDIDDESVQWTPEMDRIIIERFHERAIEEIGKELEDLLSLPISYSLVLRRANRLGLIKKALTTLQADQKPAFMKSQKAWLQGGETVRIRGNIVVPENERLAYHLVIEGDLTTGTAVVFEGGIHVKGNVVLGDENYIRRSLTALKEISLGRKCVVEQCVDGDGRIFVKTGSRIGSNGTGGISSNRTIYIEHNVTCSGKIYGEEGIEIVGSIGSVVNSL